MAGELESIRARAQRLYAESSPRQRNLVVSLYPAKRGMIASRGDLPEDLLENADRLFRHLNAAGFEERPGVEDAVMALLYLIRDHDVVPDKNSPGGLEDDAILLKSVCLSLGF